MLEAKDQTYTDNTWQAADKETKGTITRIKQICLFQEKKFFSSKIKGLHI